MAESRIKIKSTVNEMDKNCRDCPSEYYYVKYYNGSKNYKGNDNETIVFEVLLRHNEIGQRKIERSQPYTFDSLETVLSKKVKEYIIEQISEIETKFAEINNINKDENSISTVINNCAFTLDGIDIRNKQYGDNEKEKYPDWATKENIELIEEWSSLNKKLNKETSKELQKENETIDLDY